MKQKKRIIILSVLFTVMLVGIIGFISCGDDEKETEQVILPKENKISEDMLSISYNYDNKENILYGYDFFDVIKWQHKEYEIEKFNVNVKLDYSNDSINMSIVNNQDNTYLLNVNGDIFTLYNFKSLADGTITFNASTLDDSIFLSIRHKDINLHSLLTFLNDTPEVNNPYTSHASLNKVGTEILIGIGIFVVGVAIDEWHRYCDRQIENDIDACHLQHLCAKRNLCSATCYKCKWTL
ncbi:MAG: hypothetical protein LBR28_06625 [Bacteroidales bacterium]|jgi:hypothetical protein|nr:hypothetical protein [Bacteroidales bacterium]